MKKSLIIILSIIFILQTAPFVSAYTFDSDPLYSIELPEEFERVSESSFTTDDGRTFTVNYTDNTEEKFCIANLNKTETEEYADRIATESKSAFDSLGMDGSMEVISAEKIKHQNGKTAFVAVFKTVVNRENKQTVRYQKLYEFTGENNKFSFSYTAGKQEINDFDDAFNTIVINEPQIESVADKVTTAAIYGGVILVVFAGIIRFIRPSVKKKK